MPDSAVIAQRLKGDTGRLAATYLVIIMGVTIMFSGIIYAISSSQLDRPFPPRGNMSQFDSYTRSSFEELLQLRANQALAELLASLVFLNLAVLASGAFFSYFLARKSLEPIEAAMQAQSQFVSDASHELRTPLTALQATNEVALRKKKLGLAEAKELIGHNLAETIKLRDLSEALLGLARQESAGMVKDSVNLPEVILDAVQTLAPLAADKNITVVYEVPSLDLTANGSAITQIVRILLDNAIKYSPAGSLVTVAATDSGATTSITITDAGQGIDESQRSKIFDRFYRIDESRSSLNIEGSGLGLSIARAIADRNGYTVTVDSTPGGGSTFTLVVQ